MKSDLIEWIKNPGFHAIKDILAYQYVDLLVKALIILAVFMVLKMLVKKYLFPWLHRLVSKSRNEFDDKIITAFESPVEWLIVTAGIYFALKYLIFDPAIEATVINAYRSLVVGFIAWGLYDLASTDFLFTEEFKKKFKVDDILIPLLSRTIRFVIFALAIVVIIQEWGYEVNGLVAGLGLGGLAFALAAQDTLSNIFGGIVIITDKPFSIGDWIESSSVEGTVEDISFRSTKIRAFNQSLITIPNTKLAGEAITNYTRMGKRRITFHLGVTYDTPRNKLEECVKRIRRMLIGHPEIHPEMVFVYFDVFNDSSLDIFIYFFTNTTNWEKFLEVRQDVNFKIMEILEDLEVSVAFPSRSIYFENPQIVQNYNMEGE